MDIAVGDITINATIIVQMINFWIAYTMLRILLFKPVYRIVMAREQAEHDLNGAITATQQGIARQKAERLTLWQQCHSYFETNKPAVTNSFHVATGAIPPIKPSEISPQARTQLAQHVYEQFAQQLGATRD